MSALRDMGFGPDMLEHILELLPQEAAVVDADFIIRWCNRAKYAAHPDLKPGMKCYQAFDRSSPCPFCLAEQVKESGQHLKNPVCIMTGPHKNSPRHVNITLAPVSLPQSGDTWLVEIIDNVEELYRDRHELEHLNHEYENVIYALSHDLRSPLISIEGFLRKIEKALPAGDKATLAHCLDRIHANVGIMNRLVNMLLDTSRIITGILDVGEVDMEKLAQETADHFTQQAADQGAHITVNGTFAVEKCDRLRVSQVYANLVSNALKHCRGTSNLTIELGAKDRVYWVRDNGPGIPQDFQDVVFESFTHGPQHTKDSFGMGMNIVYRIMQKHGADIWIESQEGQGTMVFFSFKTGGEALRQSP
jgi:signal transduction histidine kinase